MQSGARPEEAAAEMIVLDDWRQIDAWCQRLGCSATDLANAIGDVGFSVASVRERLRELRSERAPGGAAS
jgi:hypothetical protein